MKQVNKKNNKEWIVRLFHYVPSLEDPNIGRYYRTSLVFYYEPTDGMIDRRLMDVFGYTSDEMKNIFIESIDVRDTDTYHRHL